jgi:hypothetical protein
MAWVKGKATNNRRVLTAHARIVSAIGHLEFVLMMNKTRQKYTDGTKVNLGVHAKHTINTTLYDLRNAKTLLEGTTFKNKDPYGNRMGDKHGR